jgi:hypothetical protein
MSMPARSDARRLPVKRPFMTDGRAQAVADEQPLALSLQSDAVSERTPPVRPPDELS